MLLLVSLISYPGKGKRSLHHRGMEHLTDLHAGCVFTHTHTTHTFIETHTHTPIKHTDVHTHTHTS